MGLLSVPEGKAEAYFGARRLVAMPTAESLHTGGYQATLYARGEDANPWAFRETGIALDFGLNSRLLGRGVLTDTPDVIASRVVEWDVRWVMVRSRGGVPGVALGASGREAFLAERSLYAVLTKEANLPTVGFFRLHGGVRGEVTSPFRERAFLMGGLEKRWYHFGRDFRLALEWDGQRVHVGLEQLFKTGLRLGVAGLVYENAEREFVSPNVIFVVGFGNEEVQREIENAKNLARRAARIASNEPRKD